jgi:hypothetical protein
MSGNGAFEQGRPATEVFRQETSLLMLFIDGPPGYSSLGGAPAGLRSGEYRFLGR